ncbi:MAG: hypothetical protein IPN16_21690 [Gemmatimonadetes bacterium]|nr:hypothetical protein [Gemmatimonadota bacterium]
MPRPRASAMAGASPGTAAGGVSMVGGASGVRHPDAKTVHATAAEQSVREMRIIG